MESESPLLTSLTDDQLLARVTLLAARERHATAALIGALAELDTRRLYLGEGYSSLFAYCTQALHLSEDAAYNRIRAARVATKWPAVLELMADGSLTVTAVRLLSDVLTDTNHADLFRAATRKSKREVEVLIASLNPQAPIGAVVRKLPTPRPADDLPVRIPLPTQTTPSNTKDDRGCPPAPVVVRPPRVAPLSPDHYKIQFTISKQTHDTLRRVQDLTRHTNPTGDPAVTFDRALTVLLEQLEKAKLGKTERPRRHQPPTPHGSRHVPAAVKRVVWTRDSGRCAFVGSAGRCRETGFLEYHHVVPYADGGQAIPSNIQLRCRAHNAYEAEQWFGPLMAREVAPAYDSTRADRPRLRQAQSFRRQLAQGLYRELLGAIVDADDSHGALRCAPRGAR